MASSKVEDVESASGRIEKEEITAPPRLPGVDIIRVSLTWGILLFHTALAYAPAAGYYVKSFGWSNDVFVYLSFTWTMFMDVWQMPMFFFLSGLSAFHALYRRSEQQFRDERTHRLLVPWLLLAIFNGVYSITFFAPRTPFCEQYYENGTVIDDYGLEWKYCETFVKYTKNVTFPEYLVKHYQGPPNSGQGWFLLYLFIYSQVKTSVVCRGGTDSSGGNKHVSGFFHTCLENDQHLQIYNCVAFFTHVCFFPYICVKIQSCVEKNTQV